LAAENSPRASEKEDKMSGKTRFLSSGLAAVLAVFVGIILVLNADPPSNTIVKVKARFISGDTTIPGLPNKIVNDDPAAYYENVGNNIIELMDSSKQGKCLFLTILIDQFSPRHVNLYFDSVSSGPGQDIPGYCAKPYFLPAGSAPVETRKLHMKAGGEWEKIDDGSGFPILRPKDSDLNFLTMTNEQETYVYIGFFYFDVPDLKATRKVDESRVDYWFADCLWATVKAWDWDGEKVNKWTFKPVTIPFKHAAWGNPEAWCYHPEGAIPYMVYSNASLSCDQGTYRMPWELEISR